MAADIGVLAEHTVKIAAGQEYRSAAAGANKLRFFSEVRTRRCHDRFCTGGARPDLTGSSINTAAARAKSAVDYNLRQAANV